MPSLDIEISREKIEEIIDFADSIPDFNNKDTQRHVIFSLEEGEMIVKGVDAPHTSMFSFTINARQLIEYDPNEEDKFFGFLIEDLRDILDETEGTFHITEASSESETVIDSVTINGNVYEIDAGATSPTIPTLSEAENEHEMRFNISSMAPALQKMASFSDENHLISLPKAGLIISNQHDPEQTDALFVSKREIEEYSHSGQPLVTAYSIDRLSQPIEEMKGETTVTFSKDRPIVMEWTVEGMYAKYMLAPRTYDHNTDEVINKALNRVLTTVSEFEDRTTRGFIKLYKDDYDLEAEEPEATFEGDSTALYRSLLTLARFDMDNIEYHVVKSHHLESYATDQRQTVMINGRHNFDEVDGEHVFSIQRNMLKKFLQKFGAEYLNFAALSTTNLLVMENTPLGYACYDLMTTEPEETSRKKTTWEKANDTTQFSDGPEVRIENQYEVKNFVNDVGDYSVATLVCGVNELRLGMVKGVDDEVIDQTTIKAFEEKKEPSLTILSEDVFDTLTDRFLKRLDYVEMDFADFSGVPLSLKTKFPVDGDELRVLTAPRAYEMDRIDVIVQQLAMPEAYDELIGEGEKVSEGEEEIAESFTRTIRGLDYTFGFDDRGEFDLEGVPHGNVLVEGHPTVLVIEDDDFNKIDEAIELMGGEPVEAGPSLGGRCLAAPYSQVLGFPFEEEFEETGLTPSQMKQIILEAIEDGYIYPLYKIDMISRERSEKVWRLRNDKFTEVGYTDYALWLEGEEIGLSELIDEMHGESKFSVEIVGRLGEVWDEEKIKKETPDYDQAINFHYLGSPQSEEEKKVEEPKPEPETEDFEVDEIETKLDKDIEPSRESLQMILKDALNREYEYEKSREVMFEVAEELGYDTEPTENISEEKFIGQQLANELHAQVDILKGFETVYPEEPEVGGEEMEVEEEEKTKSEEKDKKDEKMADQSKDISDLDRSQLKQLIENTIEEMTENMVNVEMNFEDGWVEISATPTQKHEGDFTRDLEVVFKNLGYANEKEIVEAMQELIASLKGAAQEDVSDAGMKLEEALHETVREVREAAGISVSAKESVEMPSGQNVPIRPDDEIDKLSDELGIEGEEKETARDFLERMIDSGNRVLTNDYDTASLEIIGLKEDKTMMRTVIDRWDLGGKYDVAAHEPSFDDRYPDISKDLVAFSFYLPDPQDLKSSTFDIQSILSTLSDELVIVTKSPTAKVSLNFQ